jgi:SAM-dependent methyltransferase
MEAISCIFCGQPSDRVVITENGYSGRKCSGCNLIFISPRPTAAEITRLYNDEHAVLYADAQFQFDRLKRVVATRTLAKIKNYRKAGSLLELGPGGGFFLKEARKWGYEPYGIELNPIEARWINEEFEIPCENSALSESSFGGRKFDIIYHSDVLSHLYDPISVFGEMNRALKNGGLLVFETGNIADVDRKYYKFFAQFSYPDHLFFFGERSLKMLLDHTGYKYIRVYREAIMLQLLLQKSLWKLKDSLKDKQVLKEMGTHKHVDSRRSNLSTKRRIRLAYAYLSQYLIRCGGILPKNGRPLKLLVVAEKNTAPACS